MEKLKRLARYLADQKVPLYAANASFFLVLCIFPLLVVLLALNGVLCGWKMEGAGVTVLALAGGCGAAMMLSMNRGHRRKRRRRR